MNLAEKTLVLASGSPRRIAMLKNLGLNPVIIKSSCEENLHMNLSPAQTVMALALRKAKAVRADIEEGKAALEPGSDYIMISADTVVAKDRAILGKPADEADAYRMLDMLRGGMNSVYSGVCIFDSAGGIYDLFYARTDVYFKDYTDEDIKAYIATGEPMDKAGAYAIQEGFGKYADHIDGPYDNVVGLPLEMILAK